MVLWLAGVAAFGQVFTFTREEMIRYTAKNPYDRFPDGRPKVPDALLEKVRGLTAEEIWVILPGEGYPNQYEGGWQILHPEKKLVGRAVTAQFMPARPDVSEVSEAPAKAKGIIGSPHQRVIDALGPGDVLVVDLFGKVDGGTLTGDNLASAIYAATKAGYIVDGGIRDLEGIFPIPVGLYHRGAHPSALNYKSVMLTGVNIPIRVGNATVMPGDVVLGDREGVYFIPPHLLDKVLKRAEVTHIHDEWTQEKFRTGKYKSTDLYPSPHDPALKKEYEEYLKEKLGKEQP
jgi:regulator of RNase E activity RraA